MAHISLIAPSSTIPQDVVDLTKDYLEELGMRVTVPADLLGKDLLCANQDEKRFFHLKEAITDASVDIIWLIRGGYGLTRLIPQLLSLKKPEKEKLFIGFSDGSVLHVFFNQVWNWPTLHGPGASQLSKQKISPESIDSTLRIVKEGLASYHPPGLQPFNKRAEEVSMLNGIVVGGNLCLLTCSLGTAWQINPSGKILFLEDVDERGYRVDRMLTHLEQAGIFKEVKAIIFGDFVGGNEANGTTLIPPVLERFSASTHLPVFSLSGCGHGNENYPLPFNVNLSFSVTEGKAF